MANIKGALYKDRSGNGAEGVRLTGTEQDHPAKNAIVITPSDTTVIEPPIRSFMVGAAGNVAIETVEGDEVILVGIQAGQIVPVQCSRIKANGTIATGIRGFR